MAESPSPSKHKTLISGKDVPDVSPRPGGYVKIQKNLEKPKPPLEDFDPNCTCKTVICKNPNHRAPPTLTVTPPSDENLQSFSLTGTETNRDNHIHEALSGWDVKPAPSDSGEESAEEALIEEPKPTVNLLPLVISSVMLLAAGKPVPKSIMEAVLTYLNCVRDDEGKIPPNIQGVLNHVAFLEQGTKNDENGS